MYEYHVHRVTHVVDGDTIDCAIDLGFDVSVDRRVRLAGIDTPESRTTDLIEKAAGLDAKDWLTRHLVGAQKIVIRTQLADSNEKYGRVLGTLFVNGDPMSLNDRMVGLGYAWGYDGGTKVKDLGALAFRKLHPTVAPLAILPPSVQAAVQLAGAQAGEG